MTSKGLDPKKLRVTTHQDSDGWWATVWGPDNETLYTTDEAMPDAHQATMIAGDWISFNAAKLRAKSDGSASGMTEIEAFGEFVHQVTGARAPQVELAKALAQAKTVAKGEWSGDPRLSDVKAQIMGLLMSKKRTQGELRSWFGAKQIPPGLVDWAMTELLREGKIADQYDARLDRDYFHAKALAVRKDSPAAVLVTQYPDVRQSTHYTCGASAFTAACQWFGVGMDEKRAADLLGTTLAKSTDPAAIVEHLRALGVAAEPREGMTVDDLRGATEAGKPVIVCVQDYGERREEGASFEYGHYLTVLRAVECTVTCQDSSIENVEGKPGGDVGPGKEDSGNIAIAGRVLIDAGRFDEVWHDQRGNGQKLDHFGIVVGPRQALGAIGKDWRTLPSGTHVDIDQAGKITAGPAGLTGKPVSHLSPKKPAGESGAAEPTKNKAEARSALEKLPKNPRGPLAEKDQVNHGHKYIDTDEEAPWGRYPSRTEWEQDSKPETLKIADLVFPQETVSEGKVGGFIDGGLKLDSTDDPKSGLRVIRHGGKDYLIDGTHRATAAELSGVVALKVRVIDLDKKRGVKSIAKSVDDAHARLSALWDRVVQPATSYSEIESVVRQVAASHSLPDLKAIAAKLGIRQSVSSKGDFERRLVQRFSERKGRSERGDEIGRIAEGKQKGWLPPEHMRRGTLLRDVRLGLIYVMGPGMTISGIPTIDFVLANKDGSPSNRLRGGRGNKVHNQPASDSLDYVGQSTYKSLDKGVAFDTVQAVSKGPGAGQSFPSLDAAIAYVSQVEMNSVREAHSGEWWVEASRTMSTGPPGGPRSHAGGTQCYWRIGKGDWWLDGEAQPRGLKTALGNAAKKAPKYASVRPKGIAFDTVQAAGKWLAGKWAALESRYGRKGALAMAVGMIATSPMPGNIAAVIAAAEAVRGIAGFFDKECGGKVPTVGKRRIKNHLGKR